MTAAFLRAIGRLRTEQSVFVDHIRGAGGLGSNWCECSSGVMHSRK